MRRLLLLCLPALLFVAACGDDGDDGGAADASSSASPAGRLADVVVGEGDGGAPTLEFATPLTTDTTEVRVLDEGTGEEVADGSRLVLDYLIVNARDGETFDSSFEAEPITVVVDDNLLPGLSKGLLGNKVGSRVLVAIAPDDAFGPAGGLEEGGIQADDTLLLLADLLEIRHPLARAEGTTVAPAAGLPEVALADDGRPTITVPEGAEPPQELVVQPLIEGAGAAVEAGQTLTVHYTGVIWGSGDTFDSSWENGRTFDVPIGTGRVIEGWDEGLVGRTVGSQVLLVVPPDKGYGAEGQPDAGIAGTDTLVFVVDILDAV